MDRRSLLLGLAIAFAGLLLQPYASELAGDLPAMLIALVAVVAGLYVIGRAPERA